MNYSYIIGMVWLNEFMTVDIVHALMCIAYSVILIVTMVSIAISLLLWSWRK